MLQNNKRWLLGVATVAAITMLAFAVQHQLNQPRVTAQQPQTPKPQPQRDTNATTHSDRTDVVIVGAGISGLSAALDLGRHGLRVTVLDMSSSFGGHAVMSQGGLSLIDTPVQRAAGIDDSPDLAFGDFIKWGEDADAEWVRQYVDHSRRDIYDWLVDLDVQFDAEVGRAPGNSVDRFHQPAGRGIGLVAPIYRECLTHDNIRFVWNVQAVKLLTKNERVVGVMTRNTRTKLEQEFDAIDVILATGGFQNNLDMVRQYWPAEFRFPERILVGSGRNSVGHGHQLASEVGGELVKMDHQWNYFTGIPDPRNPESNRGLSAANMWGIIVNADGRRFANLHNWAKEVMPRMLAHKKPMLWFVFDEATKPKFVVSGTDWSDFKKVDELILQNSELVKKAESIQQLAQLAGLPPSRLAATVRRYNELVEQGEDTDFHRFGPKSSDYSNNASPKISQPPFYAMQAYPLTRKSMGGVAIDIGCRVLTKDKRPIPGLYAVGELTGLAGINGKAALEGTFLGPCILTGRTAARSILNKTPANLVKQKQAVQRCLSCHAVKSDITKERPGYWHFDLSHKIVLQQRTDCRQCHPELTPYRKDAHRINPQVLATSCAKCHVAQE